MFSPPSISHFLIPLSRVYKEERNFDVYMYIYHTKCFPISHSHSLRVYKEERNYILAMVKQIKASGCNVLLVQKSILRDATTELSLHYLAKAKIMVVRDIEREDIEFISKVSLSAESEFGQSLTRVQV